MYTQCPHCETIFVLTQAQLDARAGRVRCGQCQQVFRGDRYMFDTLPVQIAESDADDIDDDSEAQRRPATKKELKLARGRRPPPADDFMEDSRIPTVADLAWMQAQAQRPAPRRLLWTLASLLLVLVGVAQYAYFERAILLKHPSVREYLARLCAAIDCAVPLPQDVAQLELVDVDVAPHPEFAQALSVSAILVNRAQFPQPLPRLEISFSDAQGVTIARRLFVPSDYVAQPAPSLSPQARVAVKIELTKPALEATGYEIELVRAVSEKITFF